MRRLIRTTALALACAPLLGADVVKQPAPVDVTDLAVNRWTPLKTSGFKGSAVTNAGGLAQGFLSLPPAKGVAVTGPRGHVRRLDLTSGRWVDFVPVEAELPKPARYAWTVTAADGRVVPITLTFHGPQVCFDGDRTVIVGLAQQGTVEYDLAAKTMRLVKTPVAPPSVTAGALAYDPVNREVVLATGGFTPAGGTDGTWLYSGATGEWRRLDPPEAVESVRRPLADLRDRLFTLRWLTWKNLEYRSTGREDRLDDRATARALADEAGAIAAELKRLVPAAAEAAGAAKRDYDKRRLAAAGEGLAKASALLGDQAAKTLVSDNPEALETLYRNVLVPALAAVDAARDELAVSPPPRMSSRIVYDSKNKVIVCFGGDRQDGLWGDTWVYHCDGRWWERRAPKVHPKPQNARGLAFDAKNGLVVLLESVRWWGWDRRGDVPNLWTYDVAANEWKRLSKKTVLKALRGAFWLEYDAAAECLVAMSQDLSQAWLCRLDPGKAAYEPPTPSPDVVLKATTGQYVLRDVPTAAQLAEWKAAMDAWVKAIKPNTWALAPAHGTGRPNWGRTWSGMVYDPDRHQILYRDGGHGSYHGAVTDHYDLATGRWFRSARREEPPWPMGSYFAWGRAFSLAPWCIHTYKYSLFYNPLIHRLQRVGGGRDEAKGAGLLTYDPDTGAWARDPYYVPFGGAAFTAPIVPGLKDGLACVHGWTRYGVRSSDIWYRTPDATKVWKDTGRLPRYHDCHEVCLFADPKRNRLLFYGGKTPTLHALDLGAETPKWRQLDLAMDGDATPPLPSREIVYVPKHDTFILLAGSKVGFQFWAINAETNAMKRIAIAVPDGLKPAPAHGGVTCGLQYDPVTDLCYYIRGGRTAYLYAFRYGPQ